MIATADSKHAVPALLAAILLGVQGVGAAPAPFAKGADVGWLQQMEKAGVKFYDDFGEKKDCLQILKENGIDTIRLRAWVDPSDDPVSGHCSTDEVVAMAMRARKLGMRIMIDFHYSDSWADPGKQFKPQAWERHTDFEDLCNALYDYTFEVVSTLKRKGATPEWVQVGNEIRGGMLWPEGSTDNFGQLARLIDKGYEAVKAVDPSIKVVVHLDRGNDNTLFRWFFDNLDRERVKYDVIGMSYYPYWLKSDYQETIDDLANNLKDMVGRYDKDVMVVEVGGPASQGPNTYRMLAAVIEKVREVKKDRGLGVIYWEPQGTVAFSRGYKLGCWNENGTPTIALSAFREQSGPQVANGMYGIQNRATGNWLDHAGSREEGAQVVQSKEDRSDDSQKWLVSCSDGYYRINCESSGLYLNSLGHSSEDSAVGQKHNGGGKTQLWTLEPAGSGYYRVVNRDNGKCLAGNGSREDGAPLILQAPNAGPDQQWKLIEAD